MASFCPRLSEVRCIMDTNLFILLTVSFILLGIVLLLLVVAFVVPRLQGVVQGLYGTRV